MAENKNALADYFTQQAGTLTGLAEGEQQQEEFAARTDLRRPSGFREQFSESVRAGAQQVEADVKTFGAISNFIRGNEEEAQKQLNYANRLQESYGAILEPIGDFEQFLEQPTYDGFLDELSKVGIVAPQALFSIASGGTGLIAGLLGKSVLTAGGKAASKKLLVDLQKKKLNSLKGTGPALTKEEKEILESAYQGLRAAKYTPAGQAEAARQLQKARQSDIPLAQLGFWGGAFAQGEVVGASQSFQEYEDAGYELSADEAKMALLLGVPQAALDTLGERVFFGALTKKLTGDIVSEPTVRRILDKQAAGQVLSKADEQLLKKAVGDLPAGVFLKDLGKAAATGFLVGGVQEGLTELGQEEILIRQREAIDPEYSEEQANLRRAEAAFLGFFAGAGRSAPSNVIAKAVNLMATGREVSADLQQEINLQTGIGTDQADGTVQESPADLTTQFKALLDSNNSRTAVFVPGAQAESVLGLIQDNFTPEEQAKFGVIQGPEGIVFFDTSNPLSVKDAERIQKEGLGSEETLRDILGFTETQSPTHETVVVAKDEADNILFRQTTSNTKEAVDEARENAQRRNPGAKVEVQTKEQATAESKAKLEPQKPTVQFTEDEKGAIDFIKNNFSSADSFNISDIQRGLRIGFNPTLNILNSLEEAGVVTRDPETWRYSYIQQPETAEVRKVEEDQDDFEVQQARAEGIETEEEIAPLATAEEYVQIPAKKDSAQTKDAFFPVRQEGSVKVNPSDLEDIDLSGNININQIPKAAVTLVNKLRKKYPTANFVLEKSTEARTKTSSPRVGPLTPEEKSKLEDHYAGLSREFDNTQDESESNPNIYGPDTVRQIIESYEEGTRVDGDTMFITGPYGQDFALSFTQQDQIIGRTQANRIDGFKIRQDGPLEADINVVVDEAIKDARKGLGEQFGKDAPKQRTFTVTDLDKADASLEPVLIQSLLENKELVPDSELVDSQGKFLTGKQRLRRQFEVLLGQLALANKELLYKGDNVLGFTEEMLSTIELPIFEGGQQTRTRRLDPKAGERRQQQLSTLQGVTDRIINILERNNLEIPQRLVGPLQPGASVRQTTAGPAEVTQSNINRLIEEERAYIDQLNDFAKENNIEVGQVTGLDLDPQSFDPEVVDEIGVFEPERYQESEARAKDLPLSNLNLQDGDAPTTYLSTKAAKEKKKVQPFSATKAVQDLFGFEIIAPFRNIINKLGMKENIRFMSVNDVLRSPESPLNINKEYFVEEDGIGRFVNSDELFESQKQSLIDSPATARFLRFGKDNIILIDTNKFSERSYTTAAQGVIDLSHEVGHALFYSYKNDIVGTPLGKLLIKDFDKARQRLEKAGSRKYSDPKTGFDEYFADQFAIWVQKSAQNEGAKNRVDSYFRTLVNRLKTFFNDVNRLFYNSRFAPEFSSQPFEQFIEDVSASVEAGKAYDPLTTAEKFEIAQDIENITKGAEKFGVDRKTMNYFKNKAIQMLKSGINTEFTFLPEDKKHWSVSYIFRTAAGYVKDISPELSRAFYKPSVTEGNPGYLNIRIRRFQKSLNEVVDLRDGNGVFYFRNEQGVLDLDKFNEAALLAEDDTVATENITDPAAKAIRVWLDNFYDSYIGPSGVDINKQENFFTRQWDKAKIVNDEAAKLRLTQLLEQYNPSETEIDWNNFVNKWLTNDDTLDVSDVSVGIDPRRKVLFNNIPNKAARDAELLVPPGAAIRTYIDNITRQVEYRNAVETTLTKEDLQNLPPEFKEALEGKNIQVGDILRGHEATEVMLSRIKDPIKRQGARTAVRNMLGKAGHDMSPMMRKLNSYGLLVNMLTLLPYAMIASLPDLAGPMIRSKGMVSFKEYFNQLKYSFKNKQEAEAFARDLGLVTHDALHTMYVNAYELGFMDEKVKEVADGFFKVIGLDWYTKFTRTFAAGMGQRYLIKLAQENSPESNRYLKELNITRDQIIKAYDRDSGTLDTSSQAIKDALATFVDESILRPNAAERPAWASNPYTALIFQLKSFFYAFGVNIMGGLMRETKNSYNEKGIPGAAVPLVLAASTLLPLSMLGLELREFIKYFGRGVTPGFIEKPLRGVETQDTFTYTTAFRTDGMPWGEYFLEIFDRAGIFGPFGLIFPMADSAKFGDAWFTPAFGPTAERLEDLLIDGEFRFGDIYPF